MFNATASQNSKKMKSAPTPAELKSDKTEREYTYEELQAMIEEIEAGLAAS